jgi:hypothetical protein
MSTDLPRTPDAVALPVVRDGANGNGGPPLRPPTRPFSIKAAMIVPGLGLLILVAFIGAGFLTSNPVQPTKTSTRPFSVPGTSLRARPAEVVLKVITVSGQPPGNIINAVSIPVGATRVSYQNNTAAGQGDYSAQITLTADDSQAAVENFYAKDMKKQGWQIFSTGPADHHAGAIEVLGKKAGSDGFYWEMGATVSATTFGANAPPAGTTSFTIELFQQPDPD